jgi:hypothetical protein
MAQRSGCREMLAETLTNWSDAVQFYQAIGFQIQIQDEGAGCES